MGALYYNIIINNNCINNFTQFFKDLWIFMDSLTVMLPFWKLHYKRELVVYIENCTIYIKMFSYFKFKRKKVTDC